MPIGAVMLQKFEGGFITKIQKSERKVKDTKEEGYFLIDGQQRTLAMALGFCSEEDHNYKLWVDFENDGPKNFKYRLRVTSIGQPIGYSIDGNRLPLHERREAYEYWEDSKVSNTKNDIKPWKNNKKFDFVFKISELWDKDKNKFLQEHTSQFNDEQKKRVEQFFCDLNRLKESYLPLILLPKTKVETLDEKNNELDTLTLFFERVSAGGTRLSPDDLLFSMIKQRWPESHNLVHSMQKSVGIWLKPLDFVMLAFRIAAALSDKNDNSNPNPAYFHANLAGVLPKLQDLMEGDQESKIVKAFNTLQNLVQEDEKESSIPKVMFPYMDKYLLQVLIFYIFKNAENDIDSDNVIRFCIFWMLCKQKTKNAQKASEIAFKTIKDDPACTLKDIYTKLTEKREPNNDSIFFLPLPKIEIKNMLDEVKPTTKRTLRGIHERAKDLFGEENKDLFFAFNSTIFLLYLQSKYLLSEKTIENYQPLAVHNEDMVPYDYDHLVPQSNWFNLSTNGQHSNEIKEEENKKNFNNLWSRRYLGNLIGNYRVLESSANRSRSDTSLEKIIEDLSDKNDENFKKHFYVNRDDFDLWKKASPTENKDEWDDERLQTFQYVIEKRTVELYNKLLEKSKLEEWIQKLQ
ncbi:MAG: DUF262 domain-containing protein, partial [Campylobacterales bacterium]